MRWRKQYRASMQRRKDKLVNLAKLQKVKKEAFLAGERSMQSLWEAAQARLSPTDVRRRAASRSYQAGLNERQRLLASQLGSGSLGSMFGLGLGGLG